MFSPIDPMLYFYLLIGQKYISAISNKEIIVEKPYRAYTTSMVISNKDMYDIEKILETAFEKF
jgi:hypothetical protein